MIRKNKTAKLLTGFFCLPTSAKAHVFEPQRSSAFKEGQVAYILTAVRSVDEGGYPAQVVLYADEGQLDLAVGSPIETQHAQVRKNLPARTVTGIVYPNGDTEGTLPPKGMGLPHWEFIPEASEGGASQRAIGEVESRIAFNKEQAQAAKEAAREAKKSAKKAA